MQWLLAPQSHVQISQGSSSESCISMRRWMQVHCNVILLLGSAPCLKTSQGIPMVALVIAGLGHVRRCWPGHARSCSV
jgi:hypothetical protein